MHWRAWWLLPYGSYGVGWPVAAGPDGRPPAWSALAFYNTLTGQSLIRAQPQLAQLKLTGMTQWIGGLQPELQTRIQQMLKARGWDKG